ncbi:hypothetical protein WN51_03469 [Melipona quadrifasciata]|uniref:Uncharacterized protein n=1 Tax=Melipona quadrifasciata TaxID=166423 RepID=A0A0M8ZU71_9HYME|nr:hypothetical protein WN51_03469 [Melipona quadrifasciata]
MQVQLLLESKISQEAKKKKRRLCEKPGQRKGGRGRNAHELRGEELAEESVRSPEQKGRLVISFF